VKRAGLVVPTHADVARTLAVIQEADSAGVGTVWQTVGATRPDAVTTYAAAAVQTEQVRLGTSIVPTYPRHPAALASQVLAVESLAPCRLRLGIGPSHRPTIEGGLGIPMGKPLAHLREYLGVLRSLLWEGKVDADGEYYQVQLEFQAETVAPRTEILTSTLSVNAYRLAGETADGALSWVSPVPYLVETALPALAEGAAVAKRPVPPLIAHVPVAVTTSRDAAIAATARDFGLYGRLPFYARMFEAAGVPPDPTGTSMAAIKALAVSGTPDAIASRLQAILKEGIREVYVSLVVVEDEDAERAELMRLLASIT
jgi:alkanesulfonate monooxygenase SsuD/methylene tetrahydromethanopterin reductase-like flavin-dependent oxidoreductase (luciferase family)